MRISHEDHGETSLVAIAGDFLADDIDPYRRCLTERFDGGIRNIVLDIAGLENVDSAGMESLLWTSDESVKLWKKAVSRYKKGQLRQLHTCNNCHVSRQVHGRIPPRNFEPLQVVQHGAHRCCHCS